jgi:tellurium resistance protein TerD
MSINLTKGGRINLTKEQPNLTKIQFKLGWKPNSYDTGLAFDLDASVFICRDVAGEVKLISDKHFVFYGEHDDPQLSVNHSGDSLDGNTGNEFDEVITVDLTKLHPDAVELSFIVTIHDADGRKQNFGQVSNSIVQLVNADNNQVIGQYALEDDFSTETAVQFGSLYKKDGQWLFKAVGAGYSRGLADFVVFYGGKLA